MNITNVQRKNRKAISPVLATVILIAITLIAAIAIAGFVFGLFGTFTGGPQLNLSSTSCAATNSTCQLRFTNAGGASASITGCSVYGAAGTVSGTTTVLAGTSGIGVLVHCKAPASFTAGATVSGSVVVASGSPISFSAIAS